MTYHENDEGIANYESSDGNTKFTYRKINESEIEIVEWLSSASHIVIPSHIDGNLRWFLLEKDPSVIYWMLKELLYHFR